MNKTLKKLLFGAFFAALLLCLLTGSVWAAAIDSGVYSYTLDKDSKATITAYRGNAAVLNIPATLDGNPVVKINNEVFRGHTEITSVTMPDTVTEIGTGAFFGCGVKSVQLSKGLTKLGAYAFYDCDGLTSIEIPKSLESTYDAYYSSIIYGYVYGPFIGCDNLKTVTFEVGSTVVANGLFARMNSLETVVLPDTITTIESNAFEKCENLKNITFSASLTKIEANAFMECKKLTKVTLPDTVTHINNGAFFDCTGLTQVTLSKSLINMGAYAFYNCDGLTAIQIPKSLESTNDAYYSWVIGGYTLGPFIGCDNLKTVTFEEGTTIVANGLFARLNSLETIVLPDTIITIESNAFEKCENLKNVTFSASLTKIEANAFMECKKLTKVQLPDTVTHINNGAFFDCTGLTQANLPKSLVNMGAYAFYNCDGLTSIEIPKSLESTNDAYYSWGIGGYVYGPFIGCDNLKTVTFEAGCTEIANALFSRCPGIEKIEIPETVTSIESSAFEYATGLKSIVIPDTVTTMGNYVFAGCTSLESAEWTTGVTAVSHHSFKNCTALKTLELPDNLVRIDSYALENCDCLTSLTLPATVTRLEEGAFYDCDGLPQIDLPENLTYVGNRCFQDADALTSIHIPYGVTNVGSEAFRDCDALVTVTMENSVTSLGNDAFNHCDELKDVTLSTGLTTISARCFKECPKLDQIVIPRNVTEIKEEAFNSSSKLAKVVTYSTLSTINSSAFSYPNVTVFYGIEGSYTQQWADEKGYAFVANTVAAEQAVLRQTELTLKKNETAVLDLQVLPLDAADEVIFQSSKPAVVTVEPNGKIKAVGTGSAVIKIYVGSLSATCKVDVTQEVTGLRLDKSKLSLNVPETYQLTATISPEDATERDLTWTTTDAKVAAVDENGLVTAVGNGTATITVTALSGKTASCTVTVIDPNNIPVSGIRLNNTSLTLDAFEEFQLAATVQPTNAANQALIWTSSDEAVATVDKDGLVIGQAKGTATITAAAADGYGAVATCTVTVTNNGHLAATAGELESSHPYAANCSDCWIYSHRGAAALNITFDAQTYLEEDFDFLLIYDREGNLVGEYTGDQLAGQTIRVPGSEVKLKLNTNAFDHQWGFKVTSVEIEECSHSFIDGVCGNCGMKEITGVILSGSVATGQEGTTTIELLSGGTVLSSVSVSGKTGTYQLMDVEPGSYTLRVSKQNHTPRTYELTVGEEDTVLDVKIHLIGDINGDGRINVGDAARVYAHAKRSAMLSGYEELCADVNGDGRVNVGDTARVYAHAKKSASLW